MLHEGPEKMLNLKCAISQLSRNTYAAVLEQLQLGNCSLEWRL